MELLILHVNRGLIHHKPRLEALKRLEEMHEKQSVIDQEAADHDEKYQKQVQIIIEICYMKMKTSYCKE